MEDNFTEKEKRKAFAAGWYCGFWKDTREFWKRYKITDYMYEYGGLDSSWFGDFMLGYERGYEDGLLLSDNYIV
jgi:hypothetical protein